MPGEELDIVEEFRIVTMTDCQEEMKMESKAERIPDHSILMWELKGDGWVGEKEGPGKKDVKEVMSGKSWWCQMTSC